MERSKLVEGGYIYINWGVYIYNLRGVWLAVAFIKDLSTFYLSLNIRPAQGVHPKYPTASLQRALGLGSERASQSGPLAALRCPNRGQDCSALPAFPN